jgi:hypothetical protein
VVLRCRLRHGYTELEDGRQQLGAKIGRMTGVEKKKAVRGAQPSMRVIVQRWSAGPRPRSEEPFLPPLRGRGRLVSYWQGRRA